MVGTVINGPGLIHEKSTQKSCFTLRSQRRISSSWLVRVQVSGRKLVKIYYRNDPVKYDLNLFQLRKVVFEWNQLFKHDRYLQNLFKWFSNEPITILNLFQMMFCEEKNSFHSVHFCILKTLIETLFMLIGWEKMPAFLIPLTLFEQKIPGIDARIRRIPYLSHRHMQAP